MPAWNDGQTWPRVMTSAGPMSPRSVRNDGESPRAPKPNSAAPPSARRGRCDARRSRELLRPERHVKDAVSGDRLSVLWDTRSGAIYGSENHTDRQIGIAA
jgi:hypothetical protein